ncbi:thioesterase [Geomonas limicola]|uniref:Acyl-coenzyme A thioesterase THEM4 n=1 Tax=Geomonas limicola TaxID=2740186 RepID=A0A6V8N489_9BACT|nr:PaaI family thioesterase [Geomonas limicola]GFO67261.1 thioesterase [Geomonas limicola]
MQHKIVKKQYNSKLCFICGLKNGSGLKASFYETESGELIATFTPSEEHQSYPGRMHGGIASAILDETIGRAILVGREEEIWGITIDLSLSYKKPIPLGVELKVVGRITEENSRFFHGTGEIVLPGGEVAVTGKGKYLKAPLDKIADFDRDAQEWAVVASDRDPEVIEI